MGLKEGFLGYLNRLCDQYVYYREGECTPEERVTMSVTRRVSDHFASGQISLKIAYGMLDRIEQVSPAGLAGDYFNFIVRRRDHMGDTLPSNLRTFEDYRRSLIEAAG